MRRLGGKVRSAVIADHRTGRERAFIFDHVDFPGPQLDDLVDLWRERAAVVLVARSEETLGKLYRHLYDFDAIHLRPLDHLAAVQLAKAACGIIGLPLSDFEVHRLVQYTEGIPALLCRCLRLTAREGDHASLDRIVRRARLDAIGTERDAIIQGRRRAERRGKILRLQDDE